MHDEQPGMSQHPAQLPQQRLPSYTQPTRNLSEIEVESCEKGTDSPAYDDLVGGVVAEVVSTVSDEESDGTSTPRLQIYPSQTSVLV